MTLKKILLILLTWANLCTVSAQLNPLSIGTIHPGDSIVIKYDALINNPLVPPGTTQISNQGTISGSNFSNVLTDDPDTGPANDPTITVLNMFPLPVTLTELRASQAGSVILLKWKVVEEYNLEKYEIERSTDGRAYTKIGEVAARNSSGQHEYNFSDLQPFNANNFYRLRIIDIDGSIKFSPVVKVRIGGVSPSVNIFPNPVTAKTISVQMQQVPPGQYTLRLFNGIGQIILTKQLSHTGGSGTEVVYLPATTARGLYQLEIRNKYRVDNFKLLIQ